jgi:hypothetical protein
MTPGSRVQVEYPGHKAHGKSALVLDVFRGDLNGHDLGPLVTIRFEDGCEIALPPTNLRVISQRHAA